MMNDRPYRRQNVVKPGNGVKRFQDSRGTNARSEIEKVRSSASTPGDRHTRRGALRFFLLDF